MKKLLIALAFLLTLAACNKPAPKHEPTDTPPPVESTEPIAAQPPFDDILCEIAAVIKAHYDRFYTFGRFTYTVANEHETDGTTRYDLDISVEMTYSLMATDDPAVLGMLATLDKVADETAAARLRSHIDTYIESLMLMYGHVETSTFHFAVEYPIMVEDAPDYRFFVGVSDDLWLENPLMAPIANSATPQTDDERFAGGRDAAELLLTNFGENDEY